MYLKMCTHFLALQGSKCCKCDVMAVKMVRLHLNLEPPLWAPCPPLERSAPHLHTPAAPPRPSPGLQDVKFLGPSQSEHRWRMALQPGQTHTRH